MSGSISTRPSVPAVPTRYIVRIAFLTTGSLSYSGRQKRLWSHRPTESSDCPEEGKLSIDWQVLCVILACIAREVFALAQPQSTKFYTGAGVVLDLFILAIFVRLLAAGTYVSPTSGPGGLLVAMTNQTLFMALLIGAVGTAVSIVTGTVRYVRLSRITLPEAVRR